METLFKIIRVDGEREPRESVQATRLNEDELMIYFSQHHQACKRKERESIEIGKNFIAEVCNSLLKITLIRGVLVV